MRFVIGITIAVLTFLAAPVWAADFRLCGWRLMEPEEDRRPDGVFDPHPHAPAAVWLRLERPGYDRPQFCGATLVATDWVLSARHCFEGKTWNRTHALIGSRVAVASGKGALRHVTAAICPPVTDPHSLETDIVLLKLDAPVPSDYPVARLARQPQLNAADDPRRGWLASWQTRGRDRLQLSISVAPMLVEGQDADGLLVASRLRPSDDGPCGGESGSGFFLRDVEEPTLLAVLSSIAADPRDERSRRAVCMRRHTRALFTPITHLADWIEDTMAACDADPDCFRRE